MSRKKNRLTGTAALEEAFNAINHEPLLDRLGIELNPDLLCLALTHRSFGNENGNLPNNERLEFLGDAVLGVSVAHQLYLQYPTSPESVISKMRASIVSRYGLADIARSINLGDYILLGRGERMTEGKDKDSILADTTEALFGAIYLEHGFDAAKNVILALCKDKIDHATAQGLHQDWKTTLQERVSELKYELPEYTATHEGPEHDLTFTAQVWVNGEVMGTGVGHNKKLAEQEAARVAYERLA
ncbi:ribonuclease III [Corynebacterium spheniscorum]|uniref:Ribonuclease 3 n=1 Tax=Corynebacterium spheniscorum TaxID=185761 RepID=A0A1I2RHS0_9CORY|nr:ribonuclease III [Corynebacterium spheniscorum]KAA8722604.1 ribonuclease III [Corynebacterium spheniscorum]SFG37401.1 RNAse III [Corynebacterium spheniscorum]